LLAKRMWYVHYTRIELRSEHLSRNRPQPPIFQRRIHAKPNNLLAFFPSHASKGWVSHLRPRGLNILSRVTRFATSPPRCRAMAPMIEYKVCARTTSTPEVLRLSDFRMVSPHLDRTVSAASNTHIPGLPSCNLVQGICLSNLRKPGSVESFALGEGRDVF
jgi:hypothetical protein